LNSCIFQLFQEAVRHHELFQCLWIMPPWLPCLKQCVIHSIFLKSFKLYSILNALFWTKCFINSKLELPNLKIMYFQNSCSNTLTAFSKRIDQYFGRYAQNFIY
jgi:hypothetical protein